MKKAILLTAFAASFGLASFAQYPAAFTAETPVGGNKYYLHIDNSLNDGYVRQTNFLTNEGAEFKTVAYEPGEMTGYNLYMSDDYGYKTLALQDEKGITYGPVWDEEAQTYKWSQSWNMAILTCPSSIYNNYSLNYQGYFADANGGFSNMTQGYIRFVSQAQMNFHNKAQELADCLNPDNRMPGYGTAYNGQPYSDLIAAIETKGTAWADQLAALEKANEAYLAAVEAVKSDAEAEYWMGGANPSQITFTVYGTPGDGVRVAFDDYEDESGVYPQGFTPSVSNNGIIGEDGTATVTIKFNSGAEIFGIDANKDKYAATVVCSVAGIPVEAPIVFAADPVLSFDANSTQTYYNLPITAATVEPIEIPFSAFGFFGKGNDMARVNVTLNERTAQGETDAITVNPTKILSGNNIVEGENQCGILVSFNPSKVGVVRGSYIIDCGIEGVEPLVLNINACESAIDVVEEEVRFGADAAEKLITINYAGFDGVNWGKQITFDAGRMFQDPTVSIQFVDANGTFSQPLFGTGSIQAIVKYVPTEEPSAQETVYNFYMYEGGQPNASAQDQVLISHAIPSLRIMTDTRDQNIYAFTAADQEVVFELTYENIIAPYDLSDLAIRTTTDIFQVKDVVYTGNATNGLIHFIVKFCPKAANVEYSDIVYVTCGSKEAALEIAPMKLVGKAKAIANGIENVTVEGENAAAYNVAGQKVNANAKGLVIKNGVKNFNK